MDPVAPEPLPFPNPPEGPTYLKRTPRGSFMEDIQSWGPALETLANLLSLGNLAKDTITIPTLLSTVMGPGRGRFQGWIPPKMFKAMEKPRTKFPVEVQRSHPEDSRYGQAERIGATPTLPPPEKISLKVYTEPHERSYGAHPLHLEAGLRETAVHEGVHGLYGGKSGMGYPPKKFWFDLANHYKKLFPRRGAARTKAPLTAEGIVEGMALNVLLGGQHGPRKPLPPGDWDPFIANLLRQSGTRPLRKPTKTVEDVDRTLSDMILGQRP